MSKKPETVFKEKVFRKIKPIPGLWVVKIQQVALRGIPDLIMCHSGRLIAWELKVGHNKSNKLQDYVLEDIKSAGGCARVVTPENLDTAIQEDILCNG